jgi:hypothetical protein
MIIVDTVYQRVLAIANKEQRGYITPIEFNLMANQAQMAIFEQYFYDRSQTARQEGNKLGHADVDSILDEKISYFHILGVLVPDGTQLPVTTYLVTSVNVRLLTPQAVSYEAERVTPKELNNIISSRLLHPSNKRPIYILRPDNQIAVYGDNGDQIIPPTPSTTIEVRANTIMRPTKVEWGYNVVAEKALYNAGRSNNFDLHPSEESTLVNKILELAGIILNKPGLVQIADQEDIKRIQQQKM